MTGSVMSLFDLHVRVALVSAGAQGIGRAMALALAGADMIPTDGGNLAMNAGGTAGPYESAA